MRSISNQLAIKLSGGEKMNREKATEQGWKRNLERVVHWVTDHYTEGRVSARSNRVPLEIKELIERMLQRGGFTRVYAHIENGSVDAIVARYHLPEYGVRMITPWEVVQPYERHLKNPSELEVDVRYGTGIDTYKMRDKGRTHFTLEDSSGRFPRIELEPDPHEGVTDFLVEKVIAGTLYVVFDTLWVGIRHSVIGSRNIIRRYKDGHAL